jgi:hypothetical protein
MTLGRTNSSRNRKHLSISPCPTSARDSVLMVFLFLTLACHDTRKIFPRAGPSVTGKSAREQRSTKFEYRPRSLNREILALVRPRAIVSCLGRRSEFSLVFKGREWKSHSFLMIWWWVRRFDVEIRAYLLFCLTNIRPLNPCRTPILATPPSRISPLNCLIDLIAFVIEPHKSYQTNQLAHGYEWGFLRHGWDM